MNLHRFFLRFMLASLAATALIGVIVVLFQLDESGMRALATAFATTVASGLMVRLAVIHNRERTSTAGLFGMVVIVVVYVLILPLIWWHPEQGMAEAIYESLWLTAAWILLAGAAAFGFLVLRQFKEMRLASYAGLALCTACFLQLVFGTWVPNPDVTNRFELTDVRWLQAALATAVFGVLAAACVPRLLSRYWPGLGIIAAVAGWGLATYGIFWGPIHDVTETSAVVCASIAVLVAYINLILFIAIPSVSEWVRTLAISTGFLVIIGLDYLVIHEIWNLREHPWHEWVGRITAAAGIVLGCDTVALLVLAVIQRYSGDEGGQATFAELRLICPQCDTQQIVKIGKSECSNCGLEFTIHVYEKEGNLQPQIE